MQSRMMRIGIIIMIGAALVVAGTFWQIRSVRSVDEATTVSIADGSAEGFHGATIQPAVAAPDVVLTDHRGQTFRLHDQKGNVVVLFFGFTSCPDVCPTTLAHFKQVKQLLEDDAQQVKFVMVSVDPERDTPERMAQYVQAFDEDFIGLTGSMAEARVAWQAYDVKPEKIEVPGSALEYTVAHPASSYVIDPKGNLRLMHFYGLPADAVAEDLKRLLT